jgi:hypothetical protein
MSSYTTFPDATVFPDGTIRRVTGDDPDDDHDKHRARFAQLTLTQYRCLKGWIEFKRYQHYLERNSTPRRPSHPSESQES